MSTITVYSFEGPRDNPYTGEWTTQDYREAEEYASRYSYRIIANEYEFADSEVVADYTGDEDEPETCASCGAVLDPTEGTEDDDYCPDCRASLALEEHEARVRHG